jgi:hypothetical protein
MQRLQDITLAKPLPETNLVELFIQLHGLNSQLGSLFKG